MSDRRTRILDLAGVAMAFPSASGEPHHVLSDIDMHLDEGEIVGLLGRSGSGKSTLLRIAAGLIRPSAGKVFYQGHPLDGPERGIAMVFQTFALFPWLTVAENVELGLDALGLAAGEERERTRAVIELIGLNGFESAFPREISGGMRQRVGFARALVSEPALLLMDEPFSALDVLTAETLRTDFLDLWVQRQLTIESVLLVTHNLEEAVLMSDRILVLGAHPGRIVDEIRVNIEHPRKRTSPEFRAIVNEIYSILTARLAESVSADGPRSKGLAQLLPDVTSHRVAAFIDTLGSANWSGHAELTKLAASLMIKVSDVLPVAAALHMLEFGELEGGSIRLTAAGRVFAQSPDVARQRLFCEHLERFVPLASHIRGVLDERRGHRAQRERFEYELEDHLTEVDAQTSLRTVIDWGRYGGLFSYDDETRTFSEPDVLREAT